jgi:hypothetical protein
MADSSRNHPPGNVNWRRGLISYRKTLKLKAVSDLYLRLRREDTVFQVLDCKIMMSRNR